MKEKFYSKRNTDDTSTTTIYNNIEKGKMSLSRKGRDIKVYVNVSQITVTKKPTQLEVGKINNSFGESSNKEVSLNHLVEILKKHSVVPCHLSGNRKNSNFKGSNLIFLDFDNGCTLNEILAKCTSINLNPAIVYSTLSNKEKSRDRIYKFRVVFLLPSIVEEINTYRDHLKSFQRIFPEVDKNAIKPIQMFFPGKQVELISQKPIDMELLFSLSKSYGLEACTSKKAARDFNHRLNKKLSKSDNKKEAVCVRKKRGFNCEKLAEHCDLFYDFHSCSKKIFHNDLLALYSVCRKFEGGRKYWEGRVQLNTEIDDSKLISIAYYIESSYDDYLEHATSNYLPLKDKGSKYRFLSEALIIKNAKAIQLDESPSKSKSASELNKILSFKIEAWSKESHESTLIRCPAGVGKTSKLIELDLSKTIIATPNHKLSNELYTKLWKKIA